MNHIIAAINKQKNSILANEGRLLKKLIFLTLFLVLTSQPGILGETVQSAIVDAYLQVSVFVGFTLLIFIGIDSLSSFNIKEFLNKTKNYHVPIAGFLGALPGCGGAVIIVTQYIQGRISFGSLVAVLTATMGDAAFLLLAVEPKTGLLIYSISLFVGIFTGYLIDYIHKLKNIKNHQILVDFQVVLYNILKYKRAAYYYVLYPLLYYQCNGLRVLHPAN